MGTRKNPPKGRPHLGTGAIRFDSAAQRDEVARLSGWVAEGPLPLAVYIHREVAAPRAAPLVNYPKDPIVAATGRQVLSALRSGRGWPGLSALGYSLRARYEVEGVRRRALSFGCWVGSLHSAKAVLALAREHAREGRSSRGDSLAEFAGRRVTAIDRVGTVHFSTDRVTLDLPRLEALVLAAERHHRKRPWPWDTAASVRPGPIRGTSASLKR